MGRLKHSIIFCVATIGALLLGTYCFLSSAFDMPLSGAYLHSTPYALNYLFNANEIFIPYIFHDIWHQHGSFAQWIFSPVPYFFPDMFFGFIVAFFIKNPLLQLCVDNFLWIGLYFYLTLILARQLGIEKRVILIANFILLVLACGSFRQQDVFLPIWNSHFGSTVLSYLLTVNLYLHLIKNASYRKLTLISLAVLTFITSLSDPFYFLFSSGIFFLAFLLLIRLTSWKFKENIFLLVMLIIPAALGFLCNTTDALHLNINSFFKTDPPAPLIHFSTITNHQIFTAFQTYFQNNPIILSISLSFGVWGLIQFFKKSSRLPIPLLFTLLSCAFPLIISLSAVIFIEHNYYVNIRFISLRHFQPALILPAFLGIPILLSYHVPNITIFAKKYYLVCLGFLLIPLVIFTSLHKPSEFIHYYPTSTACLDTYAKAGKLPHKTGVASYWEAHLNTLLSQENIFITAMIHDAPQRYDWMSSLDEQKDKFYFVFSKASELILQKSFGKASEILICPEDTRYKIYLYPEGFSLTKNIPPTS